MNTVLVDNPIVGPFVKNTNKAFDGTAPSGLAYFESLHRAIQDEPVAASDKAFHSFMRNLGIEDGKAFKPDARMKRIRKVFVQATFPLLPHNRRTHSGNRIDQLSDTDHTDEDLLVAHLAFPRDHRM